MTEKKEINNIIFLKKLLNDKEFKDFLALMKKNHSVFVQLNGDITITYYKEGEIAYQYILDKRTNVKKEFWIKLSKFKINKLIKLVKDKDFLILLRRSKYLYFYKNEVIFNLPYCNCLKEVVYSEKPKMKLMKFS